MDDFTFIDLFAGIGGIRTACEEAGGRCVFSNEIDKFARTTYEARFPDDDHPFPRDIRDVDPDEVPDHDLLCAGFPCFPEGTMILTREGYMPIEHVQEGAEVLTHNGRWKKVVRTMKRENQSVKNVKAQGVPELEATLEHPFWVRKYEYRWVSEEKQSRRVFEDPEWVQTRELTTDHFISQIVPPLVEDDRTEEFWHMVGRWVADGWIVDRHDREDSGRAIICGSYEEAPVVEKIIKRAGYTCCPSKEETVVKFHITRNELYHFLKQFGRSAHEKRIPGWVLGLECRKAEAFLNGYIGGDGHFDTNQRGSGWYYTSSTVSPALAYSIPLLVQRAWGVVCSIVKTERPETTTIEGREVNQRPEYQMRIPRRNRSAFVEGDYGWEKVRSIEDAGKVDVYNIQVEEDESYVANGVVVHNCPTFSQSGVSIRNHLGRKHGLEDEEKGQLFFEVARILDEKRPPFLLLENVKNLKSHDSGRTWEVITNTLSEIGYDVDGEIIDAFPVVPQHRERVYIVGVRNDLLPESSMIAWPVFWKNVRQRLKDARIEQAERYGVNPSDWPRVGHIIKSDVPDKYDTSDAMLQCLDDHAAKQAAKGNGFGYSTVTADSERTRTIKARYYKDGSEALLDEENGDNPRRLTPLEIAHLFGYPDTFCDMFDPPNHSDQIVSDTQAYKQLGNSVVVPVVETIVHGITADLMDEDERPELLQPLIPGVSL